MQTMIRFVFVIYWCCVASRCYEISKQKCLEYSRGRCSNALPLIVGGNPAKPNEFPHMALIGFGEVQVSWRCGGTLISEAYVLSAAHCAKSYEFGVATKVKLGMSERSEVGEHVQERNIIKAIIHPRYTGLQKYHDIVLFKLDVPVIFSLAVAPACINTAKKRLYKEAALTAIGFGKQNFDYDHGSKLLYKVVVPILETSVCQPFYANMKKRGLPKGLIEEQYCAGFMKGGKDTCGGDSGGPLQVYDKESCNFLVMAITSFGKFCGMPKSPAIYTKVYQYLPWIEKEVWGNSEEDLNSV